MFTLVLISYNKTDFKEQNRLSNFSPNNKSTINSLTQMCYLEQI